MGITAGSSTAGSTPDNTNSLHHNFFVLHANFSLYSLNFHPNFSSQALNLEIFSSQPPKFGNFQFTSPQIWKFSVHKPPFSEAYISSQASHFGNLGRTPSPEKRVSAPPPPPPDKLRPKFHFGGSMYLISSSSKKLWRTWNICGFLENCWWWTRLLAMVHGYHIVSTGVWEFLFSADFLIFENFLAGLADLNHLDLNHWFKSRFKSTDFFIKISDLNQYFLFFFKLRTNQSCFG